MKEGLTRFQVAISLAEDTAHPKLVFSRAGRDAKNGASASSRPSFSTAWNYFTVWRTPQQTTHFVERFQHLPCVGVGGEQFSLQGSENRDGLGIAVGVCREDVMGIVGSSEMPPRWASGLCVGALLAKGP